MVAVYNDGKQVTFMLVIIFKQRFLASMQGLRKNSWKVNFHDRFISINHAVV